MPSGRHYQRWVICIKGLGYKFPWGILLPAVFCPWRNLVQVDKGWKCLSCSTPLSYDVRQGPKILASTWIFYALNQARFRKSWWDLKKICTNYQTIILWGTTEEGIMFLYNIWVYLLPNLDSLCKMLWRLDFCSYWDMSLLPFVIFILF